MEVDIQTLMFSGAQIKLDGLEIKNYETDASSDIIRIIRLRAYFYPNSVSDVLRRPSSCWLFSRRAPP